MSTTWRSVVVVVGHSPFVCLIFEPRTKIRNLVRNSQTGRKAAYPPQPKFEISKFSSFNSICDLRRIRSQLPTAGARIFGVGSQCLPACTASSLVFWGSLPQHTFFSHQPHCRYGFCARTIRRLPPRRCVQGEMGAVETLLARLLLR